MPTSPSTPGVDDMSDLEEDLVHLARLALASESPRMQITVRRLARRYRLTRPALSSGLVAILRESPLRSASGRATAVAEPIDGESRLPLVREERQVVLPVEPVLAPAVRSSLQQLLEEHQDPAALLRAGLSPTRTALFTGPPGVGKTLAARWLARELKVPLIVLDLSAVISSFLGRTGSNLRKVLDYARSSQCILLLDELDAIAKKRDDASDVGELKRLVTVLLQEVDSWPEGSLLLAATNHQDLLDPAVWRRFELHVPFPLPAADGIAQAIEQFVDGQKLEPALVRLLSEIYLGSSFNDVERDIMRARRTAALRSTAVSDAILDLAQVRVRALPVATRGRFVADMIRTTGISQRRASEITGVSRDTIRKYMTAKSLTEVDGTPGEDHNNA